MKKISFLVALGIFLAAVSAQAQLFCVSSGHRGFSVSIGGSVCSAPPAVVYAPPPVSYAQPVYPSYPAAPQAYYTQPPVVASAPPVCAVPPVYAPGYYNYSYGP